MSANIPLQLNDPISIESPTSSSLGQQLHGIVAYLGPVDFSDEAQDYVGIRLTGSSVGLGKHDGVVGGKRYFEAAPNGGIFIRYSSGKISKRKLTRLQELQLKRELGALLTNNKTGTTISAGDPGKNPNTPSPFRTKALSSSISTEPTDEGSSATSGVRSRLDEIRKRREAAINASKTARSGKSSEDDASTTSSVSNSSSFTSPRSGTTSHVKVSRGAKEGPNSASRVNELRVKQETSRPERTSGGETPLKSSPLASSLLTTPRHSKVSLSSEIQMEDMKQKLQGKDTEILQLKLALQEAKQTFEQRERELEKALELGRHIQNQKQETSHELSAGDLISLQNPREDDAEKEDLQRKLSEAITSIQTLEQEALERQAKHEMELLALNQELAAVKSRALAAEREGVTVKEQFEKKTSNAADYLKERARLTAEISALQRQVTNLQETISEYETSMEGIVLDKELLQEEKEELMDQLEEKTLEIANLQIELEETKVELEEGKAATSKLHENQLTETLANPSVAVVGGEADVALSSQNARLRGALARLREQANLDKIELVKQLRVAEKDAVAGRELSTELESLRILKAKNASEIKDLKEIVDTQNVYEQMVETLSEKVTQLEDEIIELRNAVRDLEEAGEISQEMEEVQAELNKSLRLDVEKRDTTILNLEEAIKIQRRREVELHQAIEKYRLLIDTLKAEKDALVAAHHGGEGEKSHLLQMSQRALAQASQLASDQIALRRKEADAALNRINALIAYQYSMRMDALLPKEKFIAEELAAIKGEVLLSKISAYASASLAALEESFRNIISTGYLEKTTNGRTVPTKSSDLSVDVLQQIQTIIHQGKYSKSIIEAAANCIFILWIGQWPELLSPVESRSLSSAVFAARFSSKIENLLCRQLRIMKEEGNIYPVHDLSNSLIELEDQIDEMQAFYLESNINFLPMLEHKTSWLFVKEVTALKYLFLALMAVFSSILLSADNVGSGEDLDPKISELCTVRNIIERILNVVERVDCRQICPPFGKESSKLMASAKTCEMCCDEAQAMLLLFNQLSSVDSVSYDSVKTLRASVERVLNELVSVSSTFHELNFSETQKEPIHPFSLEAVSQWDCLMQVFRQFGKESDSITSMTFQIRARDVEQRISNAILCEQKISTSETKVLQLEKLLSKRSQEVAMQTARAAELEKLLVDKDNGIRSDAGLANLNVEIELDRLRDENRVLSEAIDILHAQADEHESEIRRLKESGGKVLSRRDLFSPSKVAIGEPDFDFSSTGHGSRDFRTRSPAPLMTATVRSIMSEVAIFRPIMKKNCEEVGYWKEKAFEKNLSFLPPLSLPCTASIMIQPQDGEATLVEKKTRIFAYKEELMLTSAQIRVAMASVSITDISILQEISSHGAIYSSRNLLREQLKKNKVLMQRLLNSGFAAQSDLSKLSGVSEGWR